MPDQLYKLSWDSISIIIYNVEQHDLELPYNIAIYGLYEHIVKTAKTVFDFHSDYLNKIQTSNQCAIKGLYPLSVADTAEYSLRLKSIESALIPSPYATHDIGSLLSTSETPVSSVGYRLLAPIMGSCIDSGNLSSAFITNYAGTMASV